MSDSKPNLPRDATSEEADFFSLFTRVKQAYRPTLDDISYKVIEHIRHHSDDARLGSPYFGDMVSSGVTEIIKVFMSLWGDEEDEQSPQKDNDGPSSSEDSDDTQK